MEQAKRMGAPRAMALCECFTGALEFQAGHWDAGEAALRQSIARYHEIDAASGEALASQRLGVLLTARGKYDEAQEILHNGIAVAENAIMRAHCLTRLYAALARNRLESGNIEEATKALALGIEMGERHGNCTTCNALLLPAAVSVRVAEGDLEGAQSFCEQLETSAESYESRTWIGIARQARALILTAQNNYQSAVEQYTLAHDDFRTANYDYEAARCQAAIAQIYDQMNDPTKGEQASSLANEIFISLGAPH
jgi:ATP/maltotriose-dependent transcriptional regulator MalT